MPNLTIESADDFIASLNVHGHYIDCPICGRPMATSQNAEGSAFWSHFYSKKHDGMRPLDSVKDQLRSLITRTARAAKKAERETEAAEKRTRVEAHVAEQRRLRAKHTVSGAFLDGIVEEMEDLISMMEPYYSQADAHRGAEAKIAELRAISGEPIET